MWLGLVGVLLAVVPGRAQTPSASAPTFPSPPVAGRLAVRPRTMATATRTERAGEQQLKVRGELGAAVYVPPQCVGPRRCPLVVMPGYGEFVDWPSASPFPKLADEYGMLLLNLTALSHHGSLGTFRAVDPGVPSLLREMDGANAYVGDVDSALAWVLHNFAVDPEKIAIFGNSHGGFKSNWLGSVNPDVFSRVMVRGLGSDIQESPIPPPSTTQFYEVGEIGVEGEMVGALVRGLQARRNGYSAKILLVPVYHAPQSAAEAPPMFRWFHESWAAPAAARQAARPQRVAPMVLLTPEVLTQWTSFWTRLMQEPDSIRGTARAAHTKEVPILVGSEPVFLLMADLAALAARYPSVAAALGAAGLTADQADAYRIAFLSALASLQWESQRGFYSDVYSDVGATVSPTSVLGKNMAFLKQIQRQDPLFERMWMEEAP